MRRRLRDAWERFLLYLPLACMGVLALGTYWMVHTTPAPDTPRTKLAERHEPDYFMEGFTLKSFDEKGRLRSEVMGDKARHFADTQWMEVDQVRIRSYDEKGRLTTATANSALANEDGSEVQLMGNAIVIRDGEATSALAQPSPQMEYRSEFLHAFLNTERMKSHKPVELTRGKDRFTADSMDYDNVDQVLVLKGRVHGTLVPAPQAP